MRTATNAAAKDHAESYRKAEVRSAEFFSVQFAYSLCGVTLRYGTGMGTAVNAASEVHEGELP